MDYHCHSDGTDITGLWKGGDTITSKKYLILFTILFTFSVSNLSYSNVGTASPEAEKVQWNVYFVDKDDQNRQIFKAQQGESEGGSELSVDFPEKILGKDHFYYTSTVSSPWKTIVNGDGVQKYYIEYERGEREPDQEDPDQDAKDKLRKWLEISKQSDLSVTGQESSDQQIITDTLEDSNNRLKNLVSMVDDPEHHEIYLIARDHTPNSLIISQTFQDVKGVSQLILDTFEINFQPYVVMRISFSRSFNPESCNHDYIITNKVPAECLRNGTQTVECRKCKKEESVIMPSTGHYDSDQDGICDSCYRETGKDEAPETVHYSLGDVQIREINGKIYLFRCIDEDYQDSKDNSQTTALFICDSVIRSDAASTSDHISKLYFGSNNNYKSSHIRSWLREHIDELTGEFNTYIGVDRAYQGSTLKESYEQFDDSSLKGFEIPFQMLEDQIFILSVEEAMEYRDYLWRFQGSDDHNPESQLSAYSKAYYLRTPQYEGGNQFQYGNHIYAVDLINGNIHTVDVTDTSVGIRPVITVIQS